MISAVLGVLEFIWVLVAYGVLGLGCLIFAVFYNPLVILSYVLADSHFYVFGRIPISAYIFGVLAVLLSSGMLVGLVVVLFRVQL